MSGGRCEELVLIAVHCCGSIPQSPLEDGTTSLKTQFELEYWPGALDTQYNGRITQKLNTFNPDKILST